MLPLPVHVNREREILAGLEEVKFLFQKQRVRAHINILLARDQAGDDLRHLGVQQRLPARDGDHGGAALLYRAEALLRGELSLQDVRRVLNLATAGTCQVAAKERLEHQHERILLPARELLLEYVSRYGPGLGDGYGHIRKLLLNKAKTSQKNTGQKRYGERRLWTRYSL